MDALTAWTVKNVQIVRRAVTIIKPKSEASCRDAVETVIIDLEQLRPRGEFKKAKTAARTLASALQRVEHALNNKNLSLRVRMFFPRAEIQKWKLDSQKAAAVKAPTSLVRKNAEAKRLAVHKALHLMRLYSSVAIETKKGSRFCKLAALLYGKPNEDLCNQCRAARRVPKKSALKSL